MKDKTLLIHAWTLHEHDGNLYISYTHGIYLKNISKKYKSVTLISPVNPITDNKSLLPLCDFENVQVYKLPPLKNYKDAIYIFHKYIGAYKKCKNHDYVYSRYPTPFGWLPLFFMKNKKKVVHFVGDPLDTLNKNKNINAFSKFIKKILFYPENILYIKYCKTADKIYTNGSHIAKKLSTKNLSATALISSTLTDSDYSLETNKEISSVIKLIYVGYLRKEKNVETIIKSIKYLNEKSVGCELTIIGDGDQKEYLKNLARDLKIININFLGHIDNRYKLLEILREQHIFCFSSLSEGSPRVVLEAMANGLAVISTPVGSLPEVFSDYENILFFPENSANKLAENILLLQEHPEMYKKIRINGYEISKSHKIENFINRIFDEI